MLRISRLTDYATVLLAALAGEPERVQTAAALAEATRIAAPTVCKLLKQLQRVELTSSLVRRRRSAPRQSSMRSRDRSRSPTARPARATARSRKAAA